MARKKDDQFTAEELGESTALTRVGVTFSDSQKAQIQSLVEQDRLTAATSPPAPATEPDKHHHHGGSFVRDPVTGQRTRIEYTREEDLSNG